MAMNGQVRNTYGDTGSGSTSTSDHESRLKQESMARRIAAAEEAGRPVPESWTRQPYQGASISASPAGNGAALAPARATSSAPRSTIVVNGNYYYDRSQRNASGGMLKLGKVGSSRAN